MIGSSSAVGIALVKLKRWTDVRGVLLPISWVDRPIKDREIKVIPRVDNELLEINFTDCPDGVQVRYSVLDRGTQMQGQGEMRTR